MQRDIIAGGTILFAAIAIATVLLFRDAHRLNSLNRDPIASANPHVVTPPAIPAPPAQTLAQPAAPTPAPALPTRSDAPAPQKWTPAPQGRRGPSAPPTPVAEPLGREALGWVGTDPAADAVYVAAINNPALSPGERRNLIEDLNETGFDDPRNLTQDDLPVIEYRLAMIQQLAPAAMDDVNAAAFQEAYKDLTNMRTRLTGQ